MVRLDLLDFAQLLTVHKNGEGTHAMTLLIQLIVDEVESLIPPSNK